MQSQRIFKSNLRRVSRVPAWINVVAMKAHERDQPGCQPDGLYPSERRGTGLPSNSPSTPHRMGHRGNDQGRRAERPKASAVLRRPLGTCRARQTTRDDEDTALSKGTWCGSRRWGGAPDMQGAREALRAAQKPALVPVGGPYCSETTVSRFEARWEAARHAHGTGTCGTGRNLARLLGKRRNASAQLYPRLHIYVR